MTPTAKLAVAFMMTASVTTFIATVADAQTRRNREAAPAAPATPPVSRPFITAYTPVNTAITALDWAAADAALPALKAAATTPYETYLAWQTDFRISTGLTNAARQLTAIDGMIDSSGAPEGDLQRLNTAGGQLAYSAGDYAKSAQRLARAVQLGNASSDIQIMRIDALFRSGATDEGLAEGRAIIAGAQASGSVAPDRIYGRVALALQEADRNAELTQVLEQRVSAYPTAANFRSAIVSLLQTSTANRGRSVDALRLMQAADAMNDRRFYLEHVSNLIEEGSPNEAISMIRAGRAANVIPVSDTAFAEFESSQRDKLAEDRASLPGTERRAIAAPDARLATVVADAYLGYDNWAKAEELYTLALGKTGADAQLINTRIGITRFHANNYAGALEAFGAVQGDRSPIARMWEALTRTRMAPPAPPAVADPPAPAG